VSCGRKSRGRRGTRRECPVWPAVETKVPRSLPLQARGGPLPTLTCANLSQLFDGADEDQIRMMEERVILVDENDVVVGAASKKDCE
jgi:hypothetical protein